MGNKTSRQRKPLDSSTLKLGTCYRTIWSPDVGSDYLGKLTKKSKNKDGSWRLVFELGNEFPFATKSIFRKCPCQKGAAERFKKQTQKRKILIEEKKACIKQKCSAEQAIAVKAEKRFNKTVKEKCKKQSKAKGFNSDWNRCQQEINKKQQHWKSGSELFSCERKKCKEVADAIHKTYYS
jgi:hypothetical protein